MKKEYGLFSSIAMIVGICIGSGIFFKCDNILIASHGSISIGVMLFILAALAIIFGGLTFSELASRTEESGGLITYGEVFISKRIGILFGWFQTLIYFPTIIVIGMSVFGGYINILFNLKASFEIELLLGFLYLTFSFFYNIYIPKLGLIFQNGSTIIKLIPLLLIGILGFLYGDPLTGLTSAPLTKVSTISLLAALGPIGYSFDGWICATAICGEIKDAKRNLPLALIISPLIVLGIYILYFVGVSSFISPSEIMTLKDSYVAVAATNLLGSSFAKSIIIFIIISVMGGINGLTISYIRLPYSLAIRGNLIPFASKLRELDRNEPKNSALFAYILCIFWLLIHYLCVKFNLLNNSDISEISVAVSYVLYISLYYKVFKMYKHKEIKSFFKGVICPFLATIGSLIILSGAIQNYLFIFYALLCIIVMLTGNIYFNKHQKSA